MKTISIPLRPDSSAFDTVIAHAIRGNLTEALPLLERIEPSTISDELKATRACMLARFAGPRGVADIVGVPAVVSNLINLFRNYWHGQLMRSQAKDLAETSLRTGLTQLLRAEAVALSAEPDLDELSAAVVAFVERKGMHALGGITSPYRELMIWRREDEKRYPVTLVEGSIEVPIVFMDDFLVCGWLRYATCDKRGTGGWAKPDKLYAVKRRYDVTSQAFVVSYVHHEGQHFFDFQQFPKLEQPELEYRAKLAEIIATQTDDYLFDLLKDFGNSAARGRGLPHSHAAFWLLANLEMRISRDPAFEVSGWRSFSPAAIRSAARAELLESSAQLRALGAASVTGYLPE
jgi:hypothetical protein